MEKIFVFVGEPETGKSSLARLCVEPNTKVVGEIWPDPAAIRSLVDHLKKGTIDWDAYTGYKHYTNYIIICYPETLIRLLNELESLKDQFEISVVRFEQL